MVDQDFGSRSQGKIPISVVHFIPGLSARDGGPSRSVVGLTDALSLCQDVSVTLVSHSVAGFDSVPSGSKLVRRVTEISANHLAVRAGLVDRRLITGTLAKSCPDVLHSHGMWHLSNHWVTQLAAHYAIPLICQPRGMLYPWALTHK